MLFIWDIHIHPRYGTLTLDTIREYITQHDDDHIVFLGDYVYHFSYHRPSLLALLDLFLELADQHKHVYVLAGNHDRLGQHFVYSETEKILNQQSHPYLHIITTPELHTIQSQKFLFIPYMISRSRYTPQQEHYPDRDVSVCILRESTNTNEQESYLLNSYIEDQIQEHQHLAIIHHYYTANIKFPSIKSQFFYKDKAISPHFLDYPTTKFISWHIHHSFSYKNYLCLWAVWSTSPLETNLYQWLSQYDLHDQKWTLNQIAINPYITLTEHQDHITELSLHDHREKLKKQSAQSFQSDHFSLSFHYTPLPLSRTTVTLYSQNGSYEMMHEHIDPTLRQSLRDVQLKQTPLNMDQAVQDLVDSSSDFGSSWANWKQLLHDYLETKYGDKKNDYLTMLNDLDIKV